MSTAGFGQICVKEIITLLVKVMERGITLMFPSTRSVFSPFVSSLILFFVSNINTIEELFEMSGSVFFCRKMFGFQQTYFLLTFI